MQALLVNAPIIRVIFTVGGLILFWSLAFLFPFRKSHQFLNPKRWSNNLVFTFGNGILLSFVAPASLVVMAHHGFLNQFRIINLNSINPWIGLFIGVAILDLAIYWQHRFSHQWNWLWRLHRMHHSDIEIDTTTAGRFHTLEIALSFIYKAVLIILLGIPSSAVLIFEILLNFSSLFNHSNFPFHQL